MIGRSAVPALVQSLVHIKNSVRRGSVTSGDVAEFSRKLEDEFHDPLEGQFEPTNNPLHGDFTVVAVGGTSAADENDAVLSDPSVISGELIVSLPSRSCNPTKALLGSDGGTVETVTPPSRSGTATPEYPSRPPSQGGTPPRSNTPDLLLGPPSRDTSPPGGNRRLSEVEETNDENWYEIEWKAKLVRPAFGRRRSHTEGDETVVVRPREHHGSMDLSFP